MVWGFWCRVPLTKQPMAQRQRPANASSPFGPSAHELFAIDDREGRSRGLFFLSLVPWPGRVSKWRQPNGQRHGHCCPSWWWSHGGIPMPTVSPLTGSRHRWPKRMSRCRPPPSVHSSQAQTAVLSHAVICLAKKQPCYVRQFPIRSRFTDLPSISHARACGLSHAYICARARTHVRTCVCTHAGGARTLVEWLLHRRIARSSGNDERLVLGSSAAPVIVAVQSTTCSVSVPALNSEFCPAICCLPATGAVLGCVVYCPVLRKCTDLGSSGL